MPAAKTNKPQLPKAKRHHFYAVLLFILGTILPPLAVAARFGIGKDFWLNLILTIAGYIPGHAHNFYVQNIRNNKTHHRTPKWALRYGLVDDSTIRRHEQRSQWAGKYNDRNFTSDYDQQPLEDGQVGPSRPPTHNSSADTRGNSDGLWRPDDESFYSAEHDGTLETSESGGRWRYPTNFTDAVPGGGDAIKKKKKKKDRWTRTEDAYNAPDQKKRKRSKNRSSVGGPEVDSAYSHRTNSTTELEAPEDPHGRSYGGRKEDNTGGKGRAVASPEDDLNHEF